MQETIVNVIQGEFAISRDPACVMTTVLGSCISVCLHDAVTGIGGMNHFLLPKRDGEAGNNERFGAFSMELLINALLKDGASKDRMVAKIFGGASMTKFKQNIGGKNIEFAHDFLSDEGIKIIAESCGGFEARKVRFYPVTGKAQQFLVPGDVEKIAPVSPVPAPKPANDIMLF